MPRAQHTGPWQARRASPGPRARRWRGLPQFRARPERPGRIPRLHPHPSQPGGDRVPAP